MTKFVIRRLLLGLMIIFFGSFIVYAVLRCLPTSYVESIARQRCTSLPGGKSYAQWLAELNEVYHLDTDIFSGFAYWLKDAIQGNFGDSWFYNIPVVEKFKSVIGYSVIINIITFFLEIVICIPLAYLPRASSTPRLTIRSRFLLLWAYRCLPSSWPRCSSTRSR